MIGALTALAGCDEIPADPMETTGTVEREGVVEVGFIAGNGDLALFEMRNLAGAVAEAHHATVEAHEGSQDKLMRDLEDGKLDLVVGFLPKRSPWPRRVALTSPFPKRDVDKDTPVLRGAVHLGENRWLLSVERTIAEASR